MVIGLTWGGVRYAWTSAKVLAPLVIGLVGMILFVFYEAKVAKEPLVSPLEPTLNGPSAHRITGPIRAPFEPDIPEWVPPDLPLPDNFGGIRL